MLCNTNLGTQRDEGEIWFKANLDKDEAESYISEVKSMKLREGAELFDIRYPTVSKLERYLSTLRLMDGSDRMVIDNV